MNNNLSDKLDDLVKKCDQTDQEVKELVNRKLSINTLEQLTKKLRYMLISLIVTLFIFVVSVALLEGTEFTITGIILLLISLLFVYSFFIISKRINKEINERLKDEE